MKILKNKRNLLFTFLSITTVALITLSIAIAISCKDNSMNNKNIDPSPSVNPNLPIVNSKVIDNDYISQETGVNLFDLDVFQKKTLDEINFDLIKSAMIPQYPSTISSFSIDYNCPIIKNKILNSFTFQYSLVLANNPFDFVKQNSYMTIYLPLHADLIETLNIVSFKELAQKASSRQYLNSFNETIFKDNVMFQNIFTIDGIAFWKSIIQQTNAPFYYSSTDFNYDLNKNQILNFVISSKVTHCKSEWASYEFTIQNTLSNEYEKITINNNTYLRITLGENAVKLYDMVHNRSCTNTNKATFYIDITNWNNEKDLT